GLRLFDAAVASPGAHYVPIGLDLSAVDGPVYQKLIRGRNTGRAKRAATGTPSDLAGRLATMSGQERRDTLLDLVRTTAATVLGHDTADAVPPERAFTELGFDSLAALELRNQLNTATGLRLPATLTFDRPYARAVADLLHERLIGDSGTGGTLPEDEIRRILLTIPISRLHDAGLVPSLLELGGVRTTPGEPADAASESIDDMDTDALISMALADLGDAATEAGG
ncbi:acyl carrier protein, partial [Actinoplanes sp. NPDC049802]|uniref:acyl carrier protein n=1 Tax=Actinoplanes sp. NPDC049802 TaxID=3154742 RepID=UPI0034039947